MSKVIVIGAGPAGIMAAIEGIEFRPSDTYSLDFTVSSSVCRDIEITVEDASYNRLFDKVISVTDIDVPYHFDICAGVSCSADIKFQMGRINGAPDEFHTVSITDFSWNNEIVQKKPAQSSSQDEKKNWVLDWCDEFDGSQIDAHKWSFDTGNWMLNDDGSYKTNGWGNNEQEFYTDKNTQLSDGVLRIFAKKEKYSDSVQGDFDYTSAKLTTKNKYSTCYGKVEVRARVDSGKSLWPAIWMLPEENVYGEWASSGEIDIMEGYGSRPQEVCGTIHFGGTWPANTYLTKNYFFDKNDSTENWHTYSVEWDPESIEWYIDDVLYSIQTQWYSEGRTFPAPFNQNFYLILNLAVGGHFDGIDGIYADPQIFNDGPKEMDIDYVRVYHDSAHNNMPDELVCQTLTPYTQDADAQITNSDNGCSIKIINTGTEEYGVMGYLKNKKVNVGSVYRLDFDVSSTNTRNILVTAENSEYKRFYQDKVQISDQINHFHYDMRFEQDDLIDIKFQMGNVDGASAIGPHNILISNIRWSEQKDSDSQTLYGDADLNSVVEMSDLTLMCLHCIGDIKLTGQAFINADVLIDGAISLNDLSTMKQYIMMDKVELGVKI